MTTVVEPLTNLSSFSYMYVMGGDSYVNEFGGNNYVPGLIDLVWEDGFKNDGMCVFFYFLKVSLFSMMVLSLENDWN
jgi:hypothetical protein